MISGLSLGCHFEPFSREIYCENRDFHLPWRERKCQGHCVRNDKRKPYDFLFTRIQLVNDCSKHFFAIGGRYRHDRRAPIQLPLKILDQPRADDDERRAIVAGLQDGERADPTLVVNQFERTQFVNNQDIARGRLLAKSVRLALDHPREISTRDSPCLDPLPRDQPARNVRPCERLPRPCRFFRRSSKRGKVSTPATSNAARLERLHDARAQRCLATARFAGEYHDHACLNGGISFR